MERIRSTIGLAGIGFLLLCLAIALLWNLRGLNYTAGIATIIGLLVGASALVLYLWVHRVMGPRIELIPGERAESDRADLKYVFLHLAAVNHPLSGWTERKLSSVFRVQRRHATCEVRIDFLSKDEKQTYISLMSADWSRNPEPISYFYDSASGSMIPVPDIAKKGTRSVLDVHATGREEPLGIVVKHEGQKECYAFNSDCYFGATTGKPWCLERYRLDSEEIVVAAYLITGGIRLGPYKFLLVNQGTSIDENHSRLERLPKG